MEEEYYEFQFQKNYYPLFNQLLSPSFTFNDKHRIVGIQPVRLNKADKNSISTDLFKISFYRGFMLNNSAEIIERINKLRTNIFL